MKTQCQCCASSLGEPIHVQKTERVICAQCLGFIARWWIELGELERESWAENTLPNNQQQEQKTQ